MDSNNLVRIIDMAQEEENKQNKNNNKKKKLRKMLFTRKGIMLRLSLRKWITLLLGLEL